MTTFKKKALEALFSISSDAVFFISRNGRIQYTNPAALQILKTQNDPLLINSVMLLMPMLNMSKWSKLWEGIAIKDKHTFQVDFMNQKEQLFPVEATAMIVEMDGEETCLLRAKSSVEVNRYKNILDLTARVAKIGHWEWDVIKKTFRLSDGAYDLIGMPKPEGPVENDSVFRFLKQSLHPDLYESLLQQFWEEAFKKGESLHREISMLVNGAARQFHIHVLPIRADDRTIAMYGTVQDIEEIAERSDQMYMTQTSFEKATDMIFWVDENADFINVNEACSQHTGYSREELIKMKVFDIETTYDKSRWGHFLKLIETAGVMPVEGEHIRKDKSKYPVEGHAIRIEHKGGIYICVFIRNVEDRKKRVAELERLLKQNEKLREQIKKDKDYLLEEAKLSNNFGEIISESPNYAKVLTQVERVAKTDTTVLILGETGTGKELLARAIHETSGRSNKPLVKINCAALAAELIESELFGHEKGAFTGAFRQKIGRFETADKATIFLDEIGEIPLELQPKLLRVLQEGEFQRIGGNNTIVVDTRVIAATNRDLATLVEEGKFREDLFYRLNVFPIVNIPLRERREDIPMLLNYFLKRYQEKTGKNNLRISKGDMERLMQYPFPGNVRELENIVERAVILSKDQGALNVKAVLSVAKKERQKRLSGFLTLEDMTREHITQALERCNWKVTGKRSASELLGLNGQTLYSKMRKLGILENKK